MKHNGRPIIGLSFFNAVHNRKFSTLNERLGRKFLSILGRAIIATFEKPFLPGKLFQEKDCMNRE